MTDINRNGLIIIRLYENKDSLKEEQLRIRSSAINIVASSTFDQRRAMQGRHLRLRQRGFSDRSWSSQPRHPQSRCPSAILRRRHPAGDTSGY